MTVIESIVGSAGSMIKQQLVDEAVFLWGVRGQFEWMERELSRIRRYLKDADAKAREGNDSIKFKGWVVDVMGITYDADDAITFFVWMEEQRKRRTPIQKCLFFCCDLLNLHKAGVMIEAVKKNIEEISTSRSNFRLEEISGGESHEASSSSPKAITDLTDCEEQPFVGFDGDMAALRDNLTKGERRRCVVSIVAMGGAGKTTLARKLYDDRDVKAHFGSDVAWVCVSQTYRIKELLQRIAEQVTKLKRKYLEELTVSQLQEELRRSLQQRKYLIVVDDIWKKEAWDPLRRAFPDGNEGSRILLTTRIEDVAMHADRLSKPHKLPLLDKKESWDLFLNIVFPPREGNGEPTCPDQLEGIAKQMVGKCGGLPLAIRVLGGLSFTTSDDATVWRKVLDHHLKWYLSSETEHLSDILELSYLNLPDYLKPCFLYLGIFPEDYIIKKETLTMLWIAEGLIQVRERSSMEDVAEQCFGELAKRNMIQVIDEGNACRVHDMLRDLAIKEAKRVELFEIDDDPQLFEVASTSTSALTRVRRWGIHYSSHEHCSRVCPAKSGIPPKVRSLLCFIDRGFQPQGLGRAKWLRVLHLGRVSRHFEGHVIGELVHLKYLQVEGLVSLPSSIGKLYNLQTLDLSCISIRLPEAIWHLHRLRHLLAFGAFFDGRPQLKLLQHLHTLELSAGEWIEKKSLTKLSKLRTLRIYEFFEEFGEALIKAIQGMVHLQWFQLYGSTIVRRPRLRPFKPFNDNSQLEVIILSDVSIFQEKPQVSLEFPPMLTRLKLSETELEDDPLATLGKLKNLRFLSFGTLAFLGRKLTMPEQGFPQLKGFELIDLPDLDEWIVEEGAMPTLKHLTIKQCNKLKTLPKRLQNITTLKELAIFHMPPEFCQQLTKDGGEDWHKIQHVPSIKIFP